MEHRVLLVDDEPNLLESLKRSLRNEKYKILCANSALEALEILHREPVDVIVSDQEMPGMKGTELLARVFAMYPDTIRYILTGQATLDVAIQAINQGAISRFFIKPCSMIDLAVTIRHGLQQKELMVQAKRLLQKVHSQAAILDRMEQLNPEITQVKRDTEGAIVLEDLSDNFEEFMKQVQETLGDS